MPEWLGDVPFIFWGVLIEMAPYLLLGFFAAGVLSVFISPEFVERHLGGRGLGPIIKAALFGVPLPLCSCGVIPVAASLRRHGASRSATVAFLIATPQDGVDSILVTLSLLGPVYAVFRPIAALVSGLLGGLFVSAVANDEPAHASAAHAYRDECCQPTRKGKIARVFSYAFVALPRDIGRALLAGLVVAALISAIVPEDFFARYVGKGFLSMLVMMALGVPVYVCATASIPIAAALVLKGVVSPGAALVFLMSGPATNAATIATVWKVMGRRTALIYLGTIAVTALAAGLTLDYIFHVGEFTPAAGMPWMLPGFVKVASAVALLALLGHAALHPIFHKHARHIPPAEREQALTLKISRMTCTACATSVRRALLECEGVTSAEVDLDAHLAEVVGPTLRTDELVAAIEAIGYKAKPVEPDAPAAP